MASTQSKCRFNTFESLVKHSLSGFIYRIQMRIRMDLIGLLGSDTEIFVDQVPNNVSGEN